MHGHADSCNYLFPGDCDESRGDSNGAKQSPCLEKGRIIGSLSSPEIMYCKHHVDLLLPGSTFLPCGESLLENEADPERGELKETI